ncbi:CDGSH iron-sulfur domain-containing protein 3, mitochondrial [Hetaerina americana]|uniref:CDGSH iron-sulfur domain-containing protein 3, mitochondrial n=1 Tax=Hetaerina americana TaxID=62018 RepID=UPI003A7F346A
MSCKLLINYLRKPVLLPSYSGLRFKIPIEINANYCSKVQKSIPGMPQNKMEGFSSAGQQPVNGLIYDKKPFKFTCVKGKKYAWCLCGRSKSQPLCDGTHKNPLLKIPQRPVHFILDEDKDVWLCNCKQTSKRPFCDGTHKRQDIQAAVK